ncbi:ABC transporter ATP-binding protein [Candidatus Finniella inopinata]|uniref:ABC transporter ATP-binding protein n=1 Tax=Candidatus Finniella inopinata TaxID=1696036 RepID=A0A4Q7DJI8_9PROT|nr:ABC transporter ATP-binding protein [Candidatus Finniella inopinata]RZI46204.1 ABC transporter ATP-binding protein [Candidatus Finniella inopinata]
MTSAITCSNITKSFKTKEVETLALRGIELDVIKGEFLMLVGPSGCGKTTLISIMAGILHQDAGNCTVQGQCYNQMTHNELLDFRAKNVGFIFQSFNLIPTLSVVENVAIPLIINRIERHDAIKQAAQMVEKVGLGDRLDSAPNQLSGGQQQRIAIARALVHNPSILICDEPTSSLDHSTGVKILELMRSINKDMKTTCVVVTHDARIYQYADRIAHMDDGMITDITHNGA